MRANSVLLLSLTLWLSQLSYAEPIKVPVKDGYLAACNTIEDRGVRIFRAQLTNESASQLKLELKTFMCANNNGKMELQALALATPVQARNTLQPVTFEIIKTSVLVMNTENTKILLKINFDADNSSPVIFIDKESITEKSIDITIVGTGITKLDTVIVDESPSRGGHFRFSHLD